ncbi:MAG: AAA family ATPase, partial [Aquificae bacterium]|nr:AAA family ATPase [Aquificota bacterium]
MILKELKLENFLSHTKTHIKFEPEGITIFVGDNGAGKSSIIDGIYYALFGRSTKGSAKDLIQWGKNKATVSLIFQRGKDEYMVEREITIRGKKASTSAMVYKKEKDQFIPYYSKDITKSLQNITGITNKTFQASILIKQGEIEKLLEIPRSERAKIFEEMLDMTIYQIVSELAGEKRKELNRELEAKLQDIKDITEIEEGIQQLTQEIDTLQRKVNTLQKRADCLRTKRKKTGEEIKKLQAEKDKALQIQSRIKILQDKISTLQGRLEEEQESLKLINQLKEKLPALQKKVEKLEQLEDIYRLLNEKETL